MNEPPVPPWDKARAKTAAVLDLIDAALSEYGEESRSIVDSAQVVDTLLDIRYTLQHEEQRPEDPIEAEEGG